ncbi:tyrosine-type recombinase/integrase [Streptomyces marianii]|uniref:tyrosine-type recombinase/integrase n=1 Tax=Streptomyces marianii TaxID=1817406 RepID=UPI00389AB948
MPILRGRPPRDVVRQAQDRVRRGPRHRPGRGQRGRAALAQAAPGRRAQGLGRGLPGSRAAVRSRGREPAAPGRRHEAIRRPGRAAGLRRVRLHDLRHGQASLMVAASVDMAIVSKRLGHSTITITSDTYSHLLGGVGRDAADRASALVPRARQTAQPAPADDECDHSVTTSPTDSTAEHAPEAEEPPLTQVNEGSEGDAGGRPCGTRTHNQRIKSRTVFHQLGES